MVAALIQAGWAAGQLRFPAASGVEKPGLPIPWVDFSLSFAGQHTYRTRFNSFATHYDIFLTAFCFLWVATGVANCVTSAFYLVDMPAVTLGLAEFFAESVDIVVFGSIFLGFALNLAVLGGQSVRHYVSINIFGSLDGAS
ncbi:hypothetical protein JWZ98_13485 [Methylomonas sp. EFPC1]|uniref:hypothetical protein n=1 Tax=unclassified Methylomonas TaxID=2608980 RepID=UPI0013EEC376|nr:hypothetical protein [Methylomonas sp. LW13]QSA99700.1 hypothetical protein JWZ98_13485 [Methylomonas sp. EFPC1]